MNFLSLKRKLSGDLFKTPYNPITFEKSITNKDINLITKFCETNGYPYIFDLYSIKHRSTSFLGLNPKSNIQFFIYDFIHNLNEIYITYHLSRILLNYECNLANTMFFDIFLDEFKAKHKQINTNTDLYKEYKKYCSDLFENKLSALRLENKVLFSKRTPFMIVKAVTLFDVALYQILQLTNGYDTNISECPICSTYFVPEHGNQKYCNRTDKNGKPTCFIHKSSIKEKILKGNKLSFEIFSKTKP